MRRLRAPPSCRAIGCAWVMIVTVLTGFPNHPTGVVPPEWRSRFRRLRDTRKSSRARASSAPGFGRCLTGRLMNGFAPTRHFASRPPSAARALPAPDVVIGTSPQLLVALCGWWLRQAEARSFRLRSPRSLAGVPGCRRRRAAKAPSCIAPSGRLPDFFTGTRIISSSCTPAFKTHLGPPLAGSGRENLCC